MYKYVKKIKVIGRYLEALSLNTCAPIVHWEENTICLSVGKAKIFTTRPIHIDIPLYFLKEKFDNGLFIPQYDKSIIMPEICAPNHVQVQ